MAPSTKELWTAKHNSDMVKAHRYGKIIRNMLANGEMIGLKALERTISLTVMSLRANSNKTEQMDLGL